MHCKNLLDLSCSIIVALVLQCCVSPPEALACIIDRAVYLARRQKPGKNVNDTFVGYGTLLGTLRGEMTVLEKALGPNLHSILLGRPGGAGRLAHGR